MKDLIIYGSMPPPYGGVSVYMKRLIVLLSSKGIDYKFYQANKNGKTEYDHIPFWKLIIINLNFKNKIILLNAFQNYIRHVFLLLLMIFFNKKVIIKIHNDRFSFDYYKLGAIRRIIAKIFYSRISHLIAVNHNTDFLFVEKSKISVIPDFIPPQYSETEIKKLPEIFHQIRDKHKFLITANAFRISFYNEQDLYGIDLSIELMKRLIEIGYKDIGFIFVIPEIGERSYYEKMKKQIEEYNIKEFFHFYTKPVEYPAVINLCDLFIRPTNTDGDSVSIREALTLKIPSIASDVCSRPEGTIVFRSRDINDLVEKTKYTFENYVECKKKLTNIFFEDNSKKLIELYNSISSVI